MSNLDNKLKALPLEFLSGVPVYLTDEMVVQIKQALADSLNAMLIKPDFQSGLIEAAKVDGLMTGQAWFDRFNDILKGARRLVVDDTVYIAEDSMIYVARRAANLEDTPQ